MTHDDSPDYGTPPEPKYGQYDAALRKDLSPLTRVGVDPSRFDVERPEPRRDTFGIILGIVLLVFGTGLTGLALQGGWWALLWLFAVPFLFFGAVGLAIDVRKVPRDSNGRPLR